MLFVVTGIAFWIIFSIAMICMFISVATESSWWGLFVLMCFFGALWLFGYKENVHGTWQWVTHNPWQLLLIAIVYVVAGIPYSFVKWFYFLKKKKEGGTTRPPQISDNKDKLFNWIFYWPFGLLWDIIHDPFRKLFNIIYERISGGYQKMSDKMFAKDTPQQ